MPKQHLVIELASSPTQTAQILEQIKNAMVQAIFFKMACNGFMEAADDDFTTWQSIYLQAHHTAHICRTAQP